VVLGTPLLPAPQPIKNLFTHTVAVIETASPEIDSVRVAYGPFDTNWSETLEPKTLNRSI